MNFARRHPPRQGSYDGRIGLFDLQGKADLQLFYGHDGRVASVGLDASGEKLLSAGIDDAKLKLWDLTTHPSTPNIIASASAKLLRTFNKLLCSE